MFCEKCGKELPEGVKFCTFCGEEVPEESKLFEPIEPVPSEPVNIYEPIQPIEPVPSEPVNLYEPIQPIESVQPEPVNLYEPIQPIEPVQPEPVNIYEPLSQPEAAAPAEMPEAPKPMEAFEPKPFDSFEPEPFETFEPKPFDSVEPIEQAEPVPSELVNIYEPIQPIEPVQPEPVNLYEPIQPIEPVQPEPVNIYEPLSQPEAAAPAEMPEAPKPLEAFEPKPFDSFEPEPFETFEPKPFDSFEPKPFDSEEPTEQAKPVQPEPVNIYEPLSQPETPKAPKAEEAKSEENKTEDKPEKPVNIFEELFRNNAGEEEEKEPEPAAPQQRAVPPRPVPPTPARPLTSSARKEEEAAPVNKSELSKLQKTSPIVVISLAAVALIVIAAVVLIGIKIVTGRTNIDTQAFLVKDDKLSAVWDIRAKEAQVLELEKIKGSDFGYGGYSQLSDNHNYLYFISSIDKNGEYGTLCRFPIDKLKNKAEVNEKLLEVIDKKVNLDRGYRLLKDNSVLYFGKSDELMWYSKGQAIVLCTCENDYYLTKDEKFVVYCEDNKLYITDVNAKPSATEIDDKVENLVCVGERDYIVYLKESTSETSDSYLYDVYQTGVGKAPEKIVEGVERCYVDVDSKGVYYIEPQEFQLSLYDYVTDLYANKDTELKEPVKKDYLKKMKESKAISKWDSERFEDRQLLYEECVKKNYDEEMGAWAYYNEDDNKYYYYNSRQDKWYKFNQDAYEHAKEEYDSVDDRTALREALKKESVSLSYHKLSYLEGGNTTEVCDSVKNIMVYDGKAMIYSKVDVAGPKEKYAMDDIRSASEFRRFIMENDEYYNSIVNGLDSSYMADSQKQEDCYFCYAGAGETLLEDMGDCHALELSKDGKTAIVRGTDEDGDSVVMAYQISAEGVGNVTKLTDSGNYIGEHENRFYYMQNVTDENEGELYVFDGNASRLLAKGIAAETFFCAADGAIIGYSDKKGAEGELTVFDNTGKGELLAKDVSDFTYLGNGCYLLKKDDNLVYLNKKGKEIRLVKKIQYYMYPGTVDGFWMYY